MSSLWNLLFQRLEERQSNLTECPLVGNFSCDPGNRYPPCYNPRGLEFNTTQIITTLINCTTDSRVFRVNGEPNPYGLLSGPACRTITGDSYTLYPKLDVVNRLTSWKLPLLQLVFLTPRPPLGKIWVSLFVLLRLMGNPGGTIQNYITKIASCHGRAKFWQAAFCEEGALYQVVGEPQNAPDPPDNDVADGSDESVKILKKFQRQERLWKSLAIIIDSYDEWGRDKGDKAQEQLFNKLKSLNMDKPEDQLEKDRILNVCLSTAEALAADRKTLLLPVGSAMFLLYVSITLAMFKTWLAGAHSPGFFLNIEAYSIGFSALYFWIFCAEVLASVIGTSDSEDRIPRILNRFKKELRCLPKLQSFALHEDDAYVQRPDADEQEDLDADEHEDLDTDEPEDLDANEPEDLDADRRFKGGLYSWQPLMWKKDNSNLVNVRDETLGAFKTLSPYKDAGDNPNRRRPHFDHPLKTWFHRRVLYPGSSRFTWLIITTGVGCGFAICALVPPCGYNCRHTWLALVYGVWILSWLLDGNGLTEHPTIAATHPGNDTSPSSDQKSKIRAQRIEEYRDLFLYHFVKDALTTSTTFGAIMATQFGILNKCDCYTFANLQPKALHLPQLAPAAGVLESRFKSAYLPLVLVVLAMNLGLYPGLLTWAYHEGVRVFIQRDDGRSWFVRGQKHRHKKYAVRALNHQPQRRTTSRQEANIPANEVLGWRKTYAKTQKWVFSPIWEIVKGLWVLLRELAKACWSIVVNFAVRCCGAWNIASKILHKVFHRNLESHDSNIGTVGNENPEEHGSIPLIPGAGARQRSSEEEQSTATSNE